MSRRAKTYTGRLSRPSQPPMPAIPSQNALRKWRRQRREHRALGLKLLFEYYQLPQSSLYTEEARLRLLVLALARNHVPYFGERKAKVSKWNSHVMARFLRDVHIELQKGHELNTAVVRAHKKLPHGFPKASADSLKKRYRAIRRAFRLHVRVKPDNSLEFYGEFAWVFPYLVNEPSSDGTPCRLVPDDDDPDAVRVVSG